MTENDSKKRKLCAENLNGVQKLMLVENRQRMQTKTNKK
jgi:hypothetical protein